MVYWAKIRELIAISKFRNREELLTQDLANWTPKSWSLNLPFRDYQLRAEDMIPAFAGAIGKVSLVAAFALAWADGYGISGEGFVAENVRLEMVVGSLMLLIFSVLFLPRAAPPGTLTPLIPMIPLMVAAGVHPLSLGIMIGLLGLALSLGKAFPRIVALNSPGTRGGILVLFGLLGIIDSGSKMWLWSIPSDPSSPLLFASIVIVGLAVYLVLIRQKKTWLSVPLCLLAALAVSALFGRLPELVTRPGLPLINGMSWWQDRWQLGPAFGLETILAALPFALLAVVMWPLDATAILTMHERQYRPYEQKATFDLNQTFLVVSLRNLVGAMLGGAQTAAVWRSFLIPLGVVRRPIPGSALLLGLFTLAFAFAGYPIDIAMFPPMLHMVLVFGVYVPMLIAGLRTAKTGKAWIVLFLVLGVGYLVHPLAGWVLGILLGRLRMLREKGSAEPHAVSTDHQVK
jgi:hypothetical protein